MALAGVLSHVPVQFKIRLLPRYGDGKWINIVMRRVVACGIDIFAITYAPIIVFSLLALIVNPQNYSALEQHIRTEIIVACYFIFFWSSKAMATPGMRIMHIVINSEDGTKITLAQAFIRYLWFSIFIFWLNRWQLAINYVGGVEILLRDILQYGKFPSFIALYLPVLYTRRQQGVPDLAASTCFRTMRTGNA